MRPMILVAVLSVLSGCATRHDPGWQGNDAHPFGKADSLCQSEADATTLAERDLAYRGCMTRHGWTRPPSSER